MDRVSAIRKELDDAALAEEYIEGREFYVGVLGNSQPKALPPVEIDFTGFPEGVPKVMDSKAKWDETQQGVQGYPVGHRRRCPTSCARGSRRWRWMPIGRSACATTVGSISA